MKTTNSQTHKGERLAKRNGSTAVRKAYPYYRDIVQLVERWSGGPEAVGSSPTISTTADSAAKNIPS